MIDTEGLGDDARAAVARAETVARELGLEHVGTEHLLLGLLAGDTVASRALLVAGATRAAARHKVAETVVTGAVRPVEGPLEATPRAARAIGRAHRFSHHDKAESVGADHLLLGVLDVEGTAGQVLRGIGVDVGALRSAIVTPEHVAAETSPASADLSSPAGTTITTACPHCGEPITVTLTLS